MLPDPRELGREDDPPALDVWVLVDRVAEPVVGAKRNNWRVELETLEDSYMLL